MKTSHHILRAGLLAAVCSVSITQAGTFRVNFFESNPGTPPEVIGNADWDDVQVANTGSGVVLSDKAGSANATLAWSTGWSNPANNQPANITGEPELTTLFNSYLHLGNADTGITISGLSPGVPFTLRVYGDINQSAIDPQNRTGTLTVLGATQSLSWENMDEGTTSLVVNDGSLNHVSNVMDFSGTTDASGTMTLQVSPSSARSAINGFELVTGTPAVPTISQQGLSFENNGATESFDVTVSNVGTSGPLTITSGSVTGTDGGLFSITSGFPLDLAADDSAVVTVQFSPGGIDGAVGPATLELVSNTGGTPGTTSTSSITGDVRDPWISTVDSVDLGTVDAGAGLQPFSVTVSNIGAFDGLVGAGAFLTGPDAFSFAIVTDFNTTVPAGGSTDVDLTFDPGGLPGTYSANLELDSNDATESPRIIPLTVDVPHDPMISTRSRVVAGAFPLGSGPQTFTVRIENPGATQNLVLSPAPSLSDATNFSIDSVDSPISAGAAGEITLTFDPLGGSGTFETTLTVESNDALNPSIDIDLIAAILAPSSATPMLHYPFDEGAGATSASSVNATADNTLNFSNLGADTDWGTGPSGFGTAAKINNREGLVGATDPASWALPASTSDLTLAFWVNFDGGNPGAAPALVGALADDTTSWRHHYMIRTDAAARTTGGFIRAYDGVSTVTVQTFRPTETAISIGQWTHVATTFDSTTGVLNFYCDGFLLETVTEPGWIGWPTPAELVFSGIGNPGSFSMSGLYDDIQIYDSVLSQAEIVGLIPAPVQTASFELEIVGHDSVAGTLSLTATGIPAGQTFHLEQSTDLQNWGNVSPAFDFDSTTAQPFVIPVSGPALFIQAFEGTSP